MSKLLIQLFLVALMLGASSAQLSPTFYSTTCPNVSNVIQGVLQQAFRSDVRIGAKLIRVHFHDCMVNGCDGSLLLDDDAANGIDSEKDEVQNASTEGYDVLDDMKTALENVCPGVVSCSDILAIASQLGVTLTGGPSWQVPLGRRDARAANAAGTTAIPSPFDTFTNLRQKFIDVGLDSTDIVALSGAHTFGRATCGTFTQRLYDFNGQEGTADPTMDSTYLASLQNICPEGGNAAILTDLDSATPDDFDNNYFTNLQGGRGLLATDQMLFSTTGADTVTIVNRFAGSQTAFFDAFVQSMVNMANLNVLTGTQGEIRTNCARIN